MAKKILTVDDSKTMREMVSCTLRGAGFDVSEAIDGLDALRTLEGNPKLDLIITDLNMPNMNCFELIRALRANPAYKFTPILMLTTEGDSSKCANWNSPSGSPLKSLSTITRIRGATID